MNTHKSSGDVKRQAAVGVSVLRVSLLNTCCEQV